MNIKKTKAWEQYEAGRAYKTRIGLYETVERNRRFYAGDQWGESVQERALPHPVFNLVSCIADYLVGAVAGGRLSVTYSDESLHPAPDSVMQERFSTALSMLNSHLNYRWDRCHMDRVLYCLLLDAVLSGDGVLYCYREPNAAQAGEIQTTVWDSCELYAADMNRADIQSQEYIILSGRENVAKLRQLARKNGMSEDRIAHIVPDGNEARGYRRRGYTELEEEEQAKATVLLKFWKEDGVVWFEKATREVVLCRVKTEMHLYPVAYFNWMPSYGSFHGISPVSGMIQNQKWINRAYAMLMKHMSDTAFSKVIYDKSRIPSWSNEVGEAIAAVGGNLSDAVQVVSAGQLQEGYMAVIESAIAMTKETMGATDTALGTAQASNTSAILALQEASRVSLQKVCMAYQQCIEEIAEIWADMLLSGAGASVLFPVLCEEGRSVGQIDLDALRCGLLRAHVEVGNLTQYSASGTQNTLEKLLADGHITLKQYLEQLPAGILPMRGQLIAQLKDKEEETGENESGNDDRSDSVSAGAVPSGPDGRRE